MRTGIVQFPGSNCDADAHHVIGGILKEGVQYLWHQEIRLPNLDLVVLPGGFAYGDYLRTGALAKSSAIIPAVREFAARGGLVLGICNGFQILTEIGLLPGALLRNENQQFVCDWVSLKVENDKTPFTGEFHPGEMIQLPVAHGEGRYYIDDAGLEKLEKNRQVVFRYEGENPNGSLAGIAGICNPERNVLGLMPHPERASEAVVGGTDGLKVFKSIQKSLISAA